MPAPSYNRPFAYNVGATPSGSDQVGNIAAGKPTAGYTASGLTWWGGPDEVPGYVIAYQVPNNNHPTPDISRKIELSSTYRGNDVVLSNNAQTAYQQFGYQQSVLGQTAINDKVMFSVLVNLAQPGTLAESHFIGIGNTTMNYNGNPYGGYPGNDGQSMGYCSNGKIYYNGTVYLSDLSTWGHGDIVDICIDHSNNTMWVRVNGGDWDNNPTDNPELLYGGLEIIGGTIYPVLCPGYEGTMIVRNRSTYSVPFGFNFLGRGNASLGFVRSSSKDDASFIIKAEEISQNTQNFTSSIEAKTWLNNNGYWTSYDGV